MIPYKRNDFCMFRYKYQFVDWFLRYFHGKYSSSLLNKKTKDELRGWYKRVRNSVAFSMLLIISVNNLNVYPAPSILVNRQWIGIVIHITDTRLDYNLEMCNTGHRNNGWKSCGYNFLILRDGTLVDSRCLNSTGAHTRGYNQQYLGVGFVGSTNATLAQIETYQKLKIKLDSDFGVLPAFPHYKFNSDKDCPVDIWEQLKERSLV